jgi:alpha-galactosidase
MMWDEHGFKCLIKVQGEIVELSSKTSHDIVKLELKKIPHPLGLRMQWILHPQVEVVMIETSYSFKHKVSKSTAMTFNGYQSWTDTQPLFVNEKMPHLSFLAKPLVSKYQFDKYGDTLIRPFKHGKGQFHGFTYVTLSEDKKTTLLASCDETTGFTIFEYHHPRSQWTITKDNQDVYMSKPTIILDLIILQGSESEVFDAYAQCMNVILKIKEKVTGWTSWYYHYQNINEKIILENAHALKNSNALINLIQIDDGYQTKIGDWLDIDKSKFPHGLKSVANEIHDLDFKAGIWLAPCVCQLDSKLASEHPDWLLKDQNGQLRLGGSNWGGFAILDMQKDEVKDYLRHVFHIMLVDWGYDMVKLDFLYAACLFPTPTKSRGQLMHETMVFLRSCVGEKLILGCGVPLGSAFGLVDYCRIGCDVGLDYNDKWFMKYMHRERISTYHAINNAIGRYPLSGRFFLNDPDVFILRNQGNILTAAQKQTLALVNKFTHGLLFSSDDVREYDEAQLDMFRFCMNHDEILILSSECIKKGVYRLEIINNAKVERWLINSESKPFKQPMMHLNPYESRVEQNYESINENLQ